MDKSLRLLMTAPIAEARALVTTDLAAEGFDVRDRADGLEAERDPAPRGKATKRPTIRLRAVFSSVPGGTAVDVSPVSGAPAVRSAVASMRARLSKGGLLAEEAATTEPAEVASVAAPHARVEPAAPSADEATEDFWPFDELTSSPSDVAERPAEPQPPLNTLAVVALVLGALAPVGGIITGAIALGHIRRTGERGKGLALGGVVMGAVFTTVLSVSLVTAGALLLAPPGSSPAGALVQPTASATPVEVVGDAEPAAFVPQVGQCFVKRGAGEIGEANVVDCGVPHAYEIYEQFPLSGDAYPGDDLVARDSVGGCRDRFADFVGTGYDESRLELVYLSPTVKDWARGDRVVSCLLSDPDATVTGTLRGAAR